MPIAYGLQGDWGNKTHRFLSDGEYSTWIVARSTRSSVLGLLGDAGRHLRSERNGDGVIRELVGRGPLRLEGHGPVLHGGEAGGNQEVKPGLIL